MLLDGIENLAWQFILIRSVATWAFWAVVIGIIGCIFYFGAEDICKTSVKAFFIKAAIIIPTLILVTTLLNFVRF